jgi:hypothetical protein
VEVALRDARLALETIDALVAMMTDILTDHGTTGTIDDHVARAEAAHENLTLAAENHVSHLEVHPSKTATAARFETTTPNMQRHARDPGHADSAGATALGPAAQTVLTGTCLAAQ